MIYYMYGKPFEVKDVSKVMATLEINEKYLADAGGKLVSPSKGDVLIHDTKYGIEDVDSKETREGTVFMLKLKKLTSEPFGVPRTFSRG